MTADPQLSRRALLGWAGAAGAAATLAGVGALRPLTALADPTPAERRFWGISRMVDGPGGAHPRSMAAPTPPHPTSAAPAPAPGPASAAPPRDGAGRRAGALLVAGTGAFLLFAAAVVFVAVRWGRLPESAKVAIIGGLTAVLLVAGRLGRRAFPATATALFHLGAFLIPVDLAALLVRSGASTAVVLTVTGAVAAAALGIGARLEHSPVLGAGAIAGTVVLAAGVGSQAHGWVLLVALPGAVVTAWCTVGAIRASRRPDWVAEATLPLALLAVLVPAAVGAVVALDIGVRATITVLLTLAWVLGVALDRTRSDRSPSFGALPRVASVLLLVPALDELTPAGDEAFTAVFAGALTVLATAEAIRLRQPTLTLLVTIAAPLAVVAAGLAAGLRLEAAGLLAAGLAVVPLLVAARLPLPWAVPTTATAGALATVGAVLAVGEPSTGATALLVLGGLLAGGGVVWGAVPVTLVGGATVALGYWWHLDQAHIEATDALVLPVVVALAVAGVVAERHRSASSWFTLTPAPALLGGAALVERISGGPAVHGLVAGAVGMVAVVLGGRERALGPLVTGATLLVALTAYETVAVTAGVPTWAWLALGGTVLLGAGLALDRSDTGPVEAGRHLCDVVGATFH